MTRHRVAFVGTGFVLMHIPAISAPAGGFGCQGFGNRVGQSLVTFRGYSGGQRAVVEEEPLNTGRKKPPKRGILRQLVEQTRRALVVIEIQRIGLDVFQGAFGVPN